MQTTWWVSKIPNIPKFFKLPNVSNNDASSVHKRLLRSAINNRKKELLYVLKELSIFKKFISKQLSALEFYILKKSVTLHNKKLLQECYIINTKNYHLWRGVAAYLYSQLTKLLPNLYNMNYLRKKPIYLKQVYSFQSNQIKLKNQNLHYLQKDSWFFY